MKILIHTIRFLPYVGGLENVMAGLANELHTLGHEVEVFTQTPGDNGNLPYRVTRNFTWKELSKKIAWADVYFEANISLKTIMQGLFNRNKWYVIHHLAYERNLNGRLKNLVTLFSKNISVSNYVAKRILGKSVVIHNFYNSIFRRIETINKRKEIVFVGRLVSDKGVDDLVNAIALLKKEGLHLNCTIIGEGPERQNLDNLVSLHGLQHQVTFKGVLRGEELVKEVNCFTIFVIPSKWEEPFGIVALEGLACGCRVVCSSGGGLREATGEFGYFYPNRDVERLAQVLASVYDKEAFSEIEFTSINKYLQQYNVTVVANNYLRLVNRNL